MRSLGESFIVSADSEAFAPLVTKEHRSELRSRFTHHRANNGSATSGKTRLLRTLFGAILGLMRLNFLSLLSMKSRIQDERIAGIFVV